MNEATQPVHTTIAGALIVYVLFPLVVLGVAGMGGWILWTTRRINLHTNALEILVKDVNPVNGPSLRDMVVTLNARVENIADQPGNHAPRRSRRR